MALVWQRHSWTDGSNISAARVALTQVHHIGPLFFGNKMKSVTVVETNHYLNGMRRYQELLITLDSALIIFGLMLILHEYVSREQ
jgi:hypothetical protein